MKKSDLRKLVQEVISEAHPSRGLAEEKLTTAVINLDGSIKAMDHGVAENKGLIREMTKICDRLEEILKMYNSGKL